VENDEEYNPAMSRYGYYFSCKAQWKIARLKNPLRHFFFKIIQSVRN